MTKRAKRMRKALEHMGWECEDRFESRNCTKCLGVVLNTDDKFCSNCGTKLPRVQTSVDGATATQLERAIAYALGETKEP